jgi:two-component system cell cycle sensor histidine kinase/response regulator CckA
MRRATTDPDVANPTIQLLHVEHVRDDIELCRHEIEKAGLDARIDVVSTPEEFTERIVGKDYDLILADYRLPGWTGLEALSRLKELGLGVPLILVTGTLGEQTAVECIKLGVSDYVLKDRLPQLPVAIRRALKERTLREERSRAEQALRESEASFRLMFADNPLPMWVFDRKTLHFFEVNEAAVVHYGYSRDEFLEMKITDIRSPEEAERFLGFVENEIDSLRFSGTWKHRTKDGRVLDVQIIAHKLEFAGVPATLVVAQDVTERKQAEDALRASEESYRVVAETATDAIITIDEQSRILFVNPAAQKIFGYATEEMRGQEVTLLMPDYLRRAHKAALRRFVKTQQKHLKWENVELPGLHKSGHVIPLEVSFGEYVKDGKHIFTGIVRDITERKRAEEKLAASENRLRAIIQAEPECVHITDLDGSLLEMNPAGLAMIEADNFAEVLGKSFETWIAKYHREGFRSLLAEISRGLEGTLEFEAVGLRGTSRWLSTHAVPFRNDRDEIIGMLGVARDVTGHKLSRQLLEQSEARYRGLFQSATYGIYRATIEGELLDANPAFVTMLGYESLAELLGVGTIRGLFRFPNERDRLLTRFIESSRVDAEVDWKCKDSRFIRVRLNGRRVPDKFSGADVVEVIVENVTERHALEKQLRQAQKFEAIGQLAGGIAHDFNNMIGAILGWAELGLEESRPGDRLHSHFEKVRLQTNRAAALTRQLLAFARRQILEPRNIDLNQTIGEVLSLLEKVIGSDIELKTTLATDPAVVHADPTQIEQVLMNLCLNARDAMPHGGRLVIETATEELDDGSCRSVPYARPGRFAKLTVSDTGTGMDATTLEHIFEPFFTTKEIGKGTGLGLATVYGIVKQHGGFVHVYSELGHGSIFRIYLPESRSVVDREAGPDVQEPVRGGKETILVAEDHEGLRELARETLEHLGYRVLLATDGEEAVHRFQQDRDGIALLLFDVVLPKLGGPEAYARICEWNPSVPVVFTTGYSADTAMLSEVQRRHLPLLQKPYSPRDLARKVREALDQSVRV